jgi:DnaK suppressor protein
MKQRQSFLDKIKSQLTKRQIELNREIEQLSHENTTDRQVMDSADEAVSLSLEKLKSSIEQTEINELRLVNEALLRLKKGEYGVCIDCGGLIAQQRLEHYPYAARCIVCQETLESAGIT